MYYWKYVKLLPLVLMTGTLDARPLPDWMAVSGFASVAAAKSDNEAPYYYTRDIADEWCFDCDTIAGLQLDLFPTPWLHASAQLVKRPTDTFSSPELEWAYLSVEPTTNLKLRIGRLRSPTFMYSQVVFVNQAYPWARLPAEVYDTTAGFTRYDGAEALISFDMYDELLLQVQPYVAVSYDLDNNEINNVSYDVNVKELYGMRFDLEGSNWMAYLNYFKARLSITSVEPLIPVFPPGGPFDTPIGFEQLVIPVNAESWSYGARYEWDDVTFVFEAITGKDSGWSGYLSAIYHYDNLSPYFVYGKRMGDSNSDNDNGADRYNKSDSVTLGLRYDVRPNLSVVGEWHYTKAREGYRGSFTTPSIRDIEDNEANVFTIGLNYSFSL